MELGSQVALGSRRTFEVTRSGESPKQTFLGKVKDSLPFTGNREVDSYRLRNFPNVFRGLWREAVARSLGITSMFGTLKATIIRADGTTVDLGIISMRVVTTAGAEFIVDAFQNLTEVENMKFHGFGTGGAAEAIGNTGLTTELTTQYAVDNTRPTGSTTEGATAIIYRSLGTLVPDAAVAITEHGVFSAAAAGILLDRSLFTVINLVAADQLATTFELSITPGG